MLAPRVRLGWSTRGLRLTLSGALWASIVGLAVLLGGAYGLINQRAEEAVGRNARQLQDEAISRVATGVEAYIVQGQGVVARLAQQLIAGHCADPESCLMAELLAHRHLAEVTLTQGVEQGEDEEGLTVLAEEGRRQTTVFRRPGSDAEVCTRVVAKEGSGYVARTRCRPPHLVMTQTARQTTGEARDPTASYGFSTPAVSFRRGRTLMSDLSYSQLDDVLPVAQQRVVLQALQGVENAEHQLLGVLKVGLLEKGLSEYVQQEHVNREDPNDPYRIFVADNQGRLITGLQAGDPLVEMGDDLRIQPLALGPEVKRALEDPALQALSDEQPDGLGTFALEAARFHARYRYIKQSQDWALVVVGPDDYYLKALREQQRPLLLGMSGVFLLLFVGGVVAVRVMRRALSQIEHETKGMTRFDFSAATPHSPFADIRETLFSLEQAKTAVRAMGKYVPLELVRKLFEENREPTLGGTLREVTIFFSDIEGFTTRAEEEPPDVVAQWLGRYLEVMTRAVHAEEGTVDKFIGDSVMALWNAPRLNDEHAVLACRAALRCQRETGQLYGSKEWGGRPPLVTRIGLHVDSVMVGHFGAPDRLSYTAIGDGVNLASRLEGLNKQYGTTILVSHEVQRRAQHQFAFRRLDLVAVKGKSNAIPVYELLGALEQPGLITEAIQRYEQGLALYVAGQFAQARALLLHNPKDLPSQALAERCAKLERDPPAQPWAGISFAQSK
ncbi:MAG: Adenylate cyclase [Myxococcaceae bacterium]|nr:Adenylate cyclase [Myxococcaceae bacterium]